MIAVFWRLLKQINKKKIDVIILTLKFVHSSINCKLIVIDTGDLSDKCRLTSSTMRHMTFTSCFSQSCREICPVEMK